MKWIKEGNMVYTLMPVSSGCWCGKTKMTNRVTVQIHSFESLEEENEITDKILKFLNENVKLEDK